MLGDAGPSAAAEGDARAAHVALEVVASAPDRTATTEVRGWQRARAGASCAP
jgi:hypothetical protein